MPLVGGFTHLNHPHRLSRPRCSEPVQISSLTLGSISFSFLGEPERYLGQLIPRQGKLTMLSLTIQRASSHLTLTFFMLATRGRSVAKITQHCNLHLECTGEIKATLNIEVLRADAGEARQIWSSAGSQGRGKTGDPGENPPTSGIVRNDSHMRKSGGDPAGNRIRFALVGGEQSNHYTSAAPSPLGNVNPTLGRTDKGCS
ncbi:hypothetical protein PR048_024974 [Dryococelus australis]|uniref:Uncharacterized protein n=1 Tax=Dryococelus australis TaxID=614101 RepID=A0ABQ9GQ46_9NEOP|nr:hypothetical protein PR048_024974 [Dryococelus australis]